MHAIEHAKHSARLWGGTYQEYLPFHEWFDRSKMHCMDTRHRYWRHHSLGIEELVEQFGTVFTNSVGKDVPVQYIGEQHVKEDLGVIPSFADWVASIPRERWMHGRPANYRSRRVVVLEPTPEVSDAAPKKE